MEDESAFWDEFWMDDEEREGVLGGGLPRKPDEEAFDIHEWND